MASLSKAKDLQDRLESGLARDLGFNIREGDIVLGNFEDLDMGSTVDQWAGKKKIRKVRESRVCKFHTKILLCELQLEVPSKSMKIRNPYFSHPQRKKSTEARERLKWNRSATKNIQQRRDSGSSNASSDRSSQSSRPTTAGREEGLIYNNMSRLETNLTEI